MMSPRDLDGWLAYQSQLHPRIIDLGLDRIRDVRERLGAESPGGTVFTVAGTNGKGSCVAMLESILISAGVSVACYTSPHLIRYNERIRINGVEVDDQSLCQAFERVEQARDDTTLTYYEFGTLAALQIFAAAKPDVCILEVGLGGRLDAVNLVDANCSIVTSIGIDHVEFLGADREVIGAEKAAIARSGRPLVCGDPDPPESILKSAADIGARLIRRGPDFDLRKSGSVWEFRGRHRSFEELPLPNLKGEWQLDNAATVLAALEAVEWPGGIRQASIVAGLNQASLCGRLQRIASDPPTYADVAHNSHAAGQLAKWLDSTAGRAKWIVVLAMLEDKDVEGFARTLGSSVDLWLAAGLDIERGLDSERLVARLSTVVKQDRIMAVNSVPEALNRARALASNMDRVLVTGSFHTVAEVLSADCRSAETNARV